MPEDTQFRRLVLMFDGTWNERSNWTNVARMSEAIDNIQDDEPDQLLSTEPKPLQLVKYLPGVGTAWFGKLLGGTFGYGLSEIIKQGYLWLSNTYREGDEIFVFGFSRGAYSARSLVSLVHRCGGVLTRKPGDPARTESDPALAEGYGLYRGYSENKDEAINAAYDAKLKAFAAKNCRPVRVKLLGVWDTVGSLGVPDSAFVSKNPVVAPVLKLLGDDMPWSRKHFAFHSQGLPCIVDNAYHAVAIDEHREDFAPTLWDSRTPENTTVEQCWFVGSHSNVGGGVGKGIDGDDLWQLTYEWMQDKAMAAGLRYKWISRTGDEWPCWRTKIQDSYHLMLGGLYSDMKKPFDRVVEGSMAALLHPSVKLRIDNNLDYKPKGLEIGPNKQLVTEIPLIPLPEEICSCKKYTNAEADGSAIPSASKKHS